MVKSIRARLTLWYLFAFGVLLVAFSAYIYSLVSGDMRRRFDSSLLRNAQSMASYFAEFVERNNVEAGAQETVKELKEGRETAAIYRNDQVLASTDDKIIEAIAATNIRNLLTPDRRAAFATDPRSNRRLVLMTFQDGGITYAIAMFEPLDKLEGEIAHLRNVILFGLPAVLLAAAVGGFLLARKSLQPMIAISEQAEHINARNLNERLTVLHPDDELGRLAGVFNALLARLDSSFRVMKEFMADASHELRTPLTIVHGEAQVSLAQDRTVAEYKKSLAIIRDQSKRMARIVSDMLALARADAGEQKIRVEELYLNDLVEECCQAAQSLAGSNSIHLTCDAQEDILFLGNEEMIKRMILNLLDNAIHYTPAGGAVSVKLTSEQSLAKLEISDTGIGIPPECVGRVFDRFYRVNDPRIKANGGSGLGLSIVKLAAESHNGSVHVATQPNRGSTFTVALPL